MTDSMIRSAYSITSAINMSIRCPGVRISIFIPNIDAKIGDLCE